MERDGLQKTLILIALALVSLAIICLAPSMGIKPIFPWQPMSPLDAAIFWHVRLPRVCSSFLVGAGLAMCGMVFQALFRNPLASPFTLGVASGASLGSVLAVILSIPLGLVIPPELFALLGALITILFVFGMSNLSCRFSMNTLLLTGIAINYLFGSVVSFIQYFSDFTNVFQIIHSLMGGFEGLDYRALLELSIFVVPGILLMSLIPYELNILALGDEIAMSRGVALGRIRTLLFLGVSVVVGGIVAVCGPIGFIGILIPHIGRLLVGSDHRILTPAVLLLGGSLLTVCDTLSRTLIAPAEIPVGVLTSLLGCPFFLYLLFKEQRN